MTTIKVDIEHAAIGQVGHQGRERLVEFAQLLDVEVEVLVVRVVVRVRDLHERRPLFEETPREQAMAAQVVLAVAVVILRRFLGDVEHILLLHQVKSLLVGIGIGFGHGRAPAVQESFVDAAAKFVA